MKRVESWLCDRSWLIWGARIAVLWPLLLFWSFGFWGPTRQMTVEEIEYQRTRDPQVEKQKMEALGKSAERRLESARELGKNYGPQQYFEDLYQITREAEKSQIPLGTANYAIGEMQEMMRRNCKPSPNTFMTPKEVHKLVNDPEHKFWKSEVSYWSEQHIHRLEVSNFRAKPHKIAIRNIANWLLVTWLKGLLILLPLFLLRMTEQRGIIETILADKRAFVAALALWPVHCLKYPENIVKEIVVEAELRRLGGLWRKLTFAEQRKIRHVVASRDFRGELGNLKGQLAPSYARCFSIALLATLVLIMFAPWAKAAQSEEKSKGTAICAHQTRAGPDVEIREDQTQQDTTDWSGSGAVANLPRPPVLSDPRIEMLVTMDKVGVTEPPPDAIDHVPIRLLGVNTPIHTLHQGDGNNENRVHGRNSDAQLQLAVCG